MAKVIFEEVQCKSLINRVYGDHLPFRWTINPYRGCQHACVYCFARGTHTYLGMNPGRDFDSRISIKVNAPEVLRQELRAATKKRRKPECYTCPTDITSTPSSSALPAFISSSSAFPDSSVSLFFPASTSSLRTGRIISTHVSLSICEVVITCPPCSSTRFFTKGRPRPGPL